MVNPDMYVAGIREATSLLLENGKLSLIGRPNKMKVFKEKIENTKEYDLGEDINFLMK
jgi:dipeptidase E